MKVISKRFIDEQDTPTEGLVSSYNVCYEVNGHRFEISAFWSKKSGWWVQSAHLDDSLPKWDKKLDMRNAPKRSKARRQMAGELAKLVAKY